MKKAFLLPGTDGNVVKGTVEYVFFSALLLFQVTTLFLPGRISGYGNT